MLPAATFFAKGRNFVPTATAAVFLSDDMAAGGIPSVVSGGCWKRFLLLLRLLPSKGDKSELLAATFFAECAWSEHLQLRVRTCDPFGLVPQLYYFECPH